MTQSGRGEGSKSCQWEMPPWFLRDLAKAQMPCLSRVIFHAGTSGGHVEDMHNSKRRMYQQQSNQTAGDLGDM